MLALVMCLLVLGVACAVVLRDGLREEPDQRATKPPRTRRATVQRAPRPIRSRPQRHRPVRSGVLLVATTAGIGVATALTVGLVAVLLALALKSFGGDAP